jgi:Mn-containing catalase
MLFNFHLECGARIHKLRVYETMTEPTGREACGYLLVRGSVHAHAHALVLKKLTGVAIEKMLPVPNIDSGASQSARSTWRRAGTAGSIRTVLPITRRWPASGQR